MISLRRHDVSRQRERKEETATCTSGFYFCGKIVSLSCSFSPSNAFATTKRNVPNFGRKNSRVVEKLDVSANRCCTVSERFQVKIQIARLGWSKRNVFIEIRFSFSSSLSLFSFSLELFSARFSTDVKSDNCLEEKVVRAFENTTKDGSPEDSSRRTKRNTLVVYFILFPEVLKVNGLNNVHCARCHNSPRVIGGDKLCRAEMYLCISACPEKGHPPSHLFISILFLRRVESASISIFRRGNDSEKGSGDNGHSIRFIRI